ncbi:MAG: hypothetical protein HXY40_05945 [Chloroflexi bacterium]|nr:hypothetical protein [Chloroflexota bacterium]
MNEVSKRSNEISTGTFLIGLAILFITGYWWPGIMFVIGISSIAQALGEGKAWYAAQGGLWAIGIGLVFALGFNLPLLLIIIGVSMLIGYRFRPPIFDEEKRKNEEV